MGVNAEEFLKKVLPNFEVTDETTDDDINAAFGEAYVDKELHTKAVGEQHRKIKSVSEGKLKRAFKAMGLEDVEGKNYEELFDMLDEQATGFNDTVSSYKSQIEELKKKSSSASGKEKDELDKMTKELDDYKKLIEGKDDKINELTEAWETEKSNSAKAIDNYKLETKVNQTYQNANWTDDSDDIDKRGVWDVYIKDKYIFKQDGDKVHVYDKEGEMLQDGTSQLTADKLFENTLKEAKRFKENKGGTTGKIVTANGKTKEIDPAEKERQRKIMDRYK